MSRQADEPLVIVAVKWRDTWAWYRSPRDYWVLDLMKWKKAFLDAGYQVDAEDVSYRFDIPVVNEANADIFLGKMRPYELERETLAGELEPFFREGVVWDDVAALLPDLMVDFDARRLVSLVESPSFDLYVPEGWVGSHDDFFGEVPVEQRFWVREDRDLMDFFR